jgi:acyl-CoA synthetase (AMP-forming)/AMP-acid ligase II
LSNGLEPGDRVATWMGKTMLACVMPLAAARAGLVHVPINPVLKHSPGGPHPRRQRSEAAHRQRARLESMQIGDLADAKAIALEEWEDGGDSLHASNRDPPISPPSSTPPVRRAGPRA